VELTRTYRAELAELAARYGEPRLVDAQLSGDFFDPIHRPDRMGEVCMVIRRSNAKILLAIKTFYPPGAYRLPTGGIHQGERITDALARETSEETGLETRVKRFLAAIAYRAGPAPSAAPIFHTFAFLLEEKGGVLGSRDPAEQIKDFVEVDASELNTVAERLEAVTSQSSREIGGDWADWGRFRAVVHRAVAETLG
jgi:ADP-ribose pyrophosphatase YjhB (NUDIX family)